MPDDDRVKGAAGQPEGTTEEGVGNLKGDAEKRGETDTGKNEAQGSGGLAQDTPKTG